MIRKDSMKELRKTLTDRLADIKRALSGDIESLREGGRTVMSDSVSDAARDSAEDDINSQLAEVESREARSVMDAIERIDAGTYGVCDGCDKQIPKARLEALPYAIRCVQCQSDWEKSADDNDGWPDTDED